jgi:type IV pilus assembly protein PilQ
VEKKVKTMKAQFKIRNRHGIITVLFLFALAGLSGAVNAQAPTESDFTLEPSLFETTQSTSSQSSELKDVEIASLPGDKVQITFSMEGGINEPTSFTVDEPARIALDFPNTKSALTWRNRRVGIGSVKSIAAIEAGDRTRVVINLIKQAPFNTQFVGDKFVISIGTSAATSSRAVGGVASKQPQIQHVDFRRGDAGEGRVVVTFTDPNMVVDVREEGGKLVVDYINAKLPQQLQQRLDVVDFATPVRTIDTFQEDDNVRMVIDAAGDYEHLAYQSDNTLTIDVKPITEAEKEKTRQPDFVGEKLSLNFQDIEVRAVLQLLADFTGLNIVVSDSVDGSITLRLKNTPWDQALDIILKTKGLAKRQNGNVILIAPAEEIAEREKLELEAKRQMTELAPLRAELLQINYAKAAEIAELLKSEKTNFLSERGSVTVDQRTNSLLLRDTLDNIVEIQKLIASLDIPVRQVLIESRIVIARDDFAKDLGARLGVSGSKNLSSDSGVAFGGNQAQGVSDNNTLLNMADTTVTPVSDLSGPNTMSLNSGNRNFTRGLNVNMPVSNDAAGNFALAIIKGDNLLDLELSALQVENRGEVVSNPRVITSNQKEAVIEQGTEIPYLESSSAGAATISFKKAVLSLKVTPQITPDDRIFLNLRVNKDSVNNELTGFDVPAIDTNEVNTQVLVDNGDTVVLGGIYTHDIQKVKSKVPFLGDIPLLGVLFRTTTEINDKNELLIFVTPKILKESFRFE